MTIRKKKNVSADPPSYERILKTELNPSVWHKEREILFNHIRAELLNLSRVKLTTPEQDEFLKIAIQLGDILIDLGRDWIGSNDATKGTREKICDLVADLLISRGWNADLVREAIDRMYDLVQESPFGRYVP